MGRRNWYGKNWIRDDKRLAIFIRDRFTCLYCSRDLSPLEPREVTLDHFIPCELGGSNSGSNLVTACRSCNSSKRDKQPIIYFQMLGTRRGHQGQDLREYVRGAITRATYQMNKPLNRRLAKALLKNSQPTLEDSLG